MSYAVSRCVNSGIAVGRLGSFSVYTLRFQTCCYWRPKDYPKYFTRQYTPLQHKKRGRKFDPPPPKSSVTRIRVLPNNPIKKTFQATSLSHSCLQSTQWRMYNLFHWLYGPYREPNLQTALVSRRQNFAELLSQSLVIELSILFSLVHFLPCISSRYSSRAFHLFARNCAGRLTTKCFHCTFISRFKHTRKEIKKLRRLVSFSLLHDPDRTKWTFSAIRQYHAFAVFWYFGSTTKVPTMNVLYLSYCSMLYSAAIAGFRVTCTCTGKLFLFYSIPFYSIVTRLWGSNV